MLENTINDVKTITINDAKTIAGGIGTMLAGRYRILRRLGEGGMGSVWLAEDRQLDNRKVAIKMLPSIVVTDKRAYQQLKSEALVSLKLVHPHIVTLRAFEENNGAPFLVMDYIEGQTLSDYLAVKGKLSEKETVALLKPIAAALDYAHSEKVIHRDVKPSNIIIRKDGHPFILDFGIAREIHESMTRVTGRTISGTLLYMSPEQLRGAPPTPAQDVYSFSAMVYECLKGKPPFTSGEIAYQILNEKPAQLSGETQLVSSVMSGLSKEPKKRPMKCITVLNMGVSNYVGLSSHMIFKGLNSKSAKKNFFTVAFVATIILVIFIVSTLTIGNNKKNSVSETRLSENTEKNRCDETLRQNFPQKSEEALQQGQRVLCDKAQSKSESPTVASNSQTIVKSIQVNEYSDYSDAELQRIATKEEPKDMSYGNVGNTCHNNDVSTQMRLSELEHVIKRMKSEVGSYPSNLKELQAMYGAGVVRFLKDEWGTEIYYESDGVDYALQSAGPDKKFNTEQDNITLIRQSQIDNHEKKVNMIEGGSLNLTNVSQNVKGGDTTGKLGEIPQSLSKGCLGLMETVQSIVGFEFGKSYNLFNIYGVEEKSDTMISYRHDLQLTNGISFVGLIGIERGVVQFDMKSQKMSSVRLITAAFNIREARESIEICRKELKKYGCDDKLWPSVPTTINEQIVIKFADMTLNNGVSMMFCGMGHKNKLTLEIHIIDMPVLKAIVNGSGFVPEDKLPTLESLFNMPFGEDVTKLIKKPIPQDGLQDVLYYTFKPQKEFFNSDYYVCATRKGDNRIFGIFCTKTISEMDSCRLIPQIVATLEERYQRKLSRLYDKKNTWEMYFYDKKCRSSNGIFVANKIIRLNITEQDNDKCLVTLSAIDENFKSFVFSIDPSSMKAL